MEATKEMTAEFSANVKANIEQLADLFKAYDLAKLGYDMQEERCKQCFNEALNAGEYYAAEGCNMRGVNIKRGDRVTDEKFDFLLSDEDWDRYTAATLPILERDGLTDAEGNYTTDWLGIMGDARRALVNFIIDTILPVGMREQFSAVRLNIVQTDKLLDIVRPIVAAMSVPRQRRPIGSLNRTLSIGSINK